MLVDDDRIVLKVTTELLQFLGHVVIPSESGTDTLEILRNNEHEIDLLFLDLTLPDVNGLDLYPKLREIRQDMKVVICSGGACDYNRDQLLKMGIAGLLQKPFDLASLQSILAEHLS